MTNQNDAEVQGERQKRGVAYHEAGHLIVAWHNGGDLEDVAVFKRDKEWAGNTKASVLKGNLNQIIQYLVAGIVAQNRGAPGTSNENQSAGDLIEIKDRIETDVRTVISVLFPTSINAKNNDKRNAIIVRNAVKAAESVVDSNWDKVRIIAEELITKDQISKQDIAEILKPSARE